eukprot:scaffold581_cov127-Skeletonema_marinoi.AAC.14
MRTLLTLLRAVEEEDGGATVLVVVIRNAMEEEEDWSGASWVDEEFPLGCGEDQLKQAVMWLCCGRLWLLPISWKKKVVMRVTERDPAKFKPSSFCTYFYEQPILSVQMACHKY